MTWAILAALLLAAAFQAEAAVMVSNGQSDYRIVVPDNSSSTVDYAARELQRFLREMTGVRLPIVSESASGDGPAFLLGPCRKSARTGLVKEVAKLREDGVLIKALGSDIALLGQNERGNLYSV